MNLIQQANALRKLNEKLILKTEKKNDGTYIIKNWMETSDALNKLLDYKFLENQVMGIFAIDSNMNIRIDTWTSSARTQALLTERMETLRESIDSCIDLIKEYTCEDIEIPKDGGIINTRMPDEVDMKKMSRICDDLDKVFNQCPLIEDEVKFIGVEKGSVYFAFITTVISINIVGKMLNAALDVQRKYYQNEMLKNKLESMEDIGNVMKPVIEKLEDEVKEFSREKAMEMGEAKGLEPEDIERLTLSIRTLSSLIGQGVQMQCVLSEREEKSDMVFPNAEDFKSLIEGIKMLK